MSSNQSPLSARIASYYTQLSSVATELNAVSDELGKSISEIDAALKKLNLGISAWVVINSARLDEDSGGDLHWTEEIGYAKVNGKWGISLRTWESGLGDGDDNVEESLFNDAPRALRLAAIEKIPELLEKLSNEAVKTTQKLQSRLDDVQMVAAAMKGVEQPQGRGGGFRVLGSKIDGLLVESPKGFNLSGGAIIGSVPAESTKGFHVKGSGGAGVTDRPSKEVEK
jgi:prefoldin subunit 5